MTTFRIDGVSKAKGKAISIVVDAESERDAVCQAVASKQMAVTRVVAVRQRRTGNPRHIRTILLLIAAASTMALVVTAIILIDESGILEPPTQEERLARIRANVSGGAWLIRQNASSEVLRGLDIYLVPISLPDTARDHLKAAVALALLHMNDRAKSIWRDEDKTKVAERTQRLLKIINDVGNQSTPDIEHTIHQLFSSEYYKYIRNTSEYQIISKQDVIAPLAQSLAASTTSTSVDGKYEIRDIPGGRYLIVAHLATEQVAALWVLPVDILKDGSEVLDLSNKNAALLATKK